MALVGTSGASSSSARLRMYDVFLSFYGEDTRRNFTDHLYAALKRKGIICFRDDEKLERGKYISQELLNAIQKSQYAVVVISKRYAFSKWCLIELTEIMKCRAQIGLIVLPVFYDVDPSDVRKQSGSVAKAFAKHNESTNVEEEQRKVWRVALKDIGNLSGWHVADRHEAAIVEDISRKILNGVKHTPSNTIKRLVGIHSRAYELISLLSLGSNKVCSVGICGMGGIGKTTLAKVVYDQVSPQFEVSCFVVDVREVTRNQGVIHLQTQVVSKILQEDKVKIWNMYMGTDMIARLVCSRNVLMVLDDVDTEDQLKALTGRHFQFGQGSKVIVTSRDRHLLKSNVDKVYDLKELSNDESLELFSWKAFKKDYPEENYVNLSKDIVGYAQGLPLALEIYGSYLFGRTMDVWKSAQEQLKKNLKADILKKLQISYEGLEDSQKRLFLDIACLFNGKYDPDDYQKLKCLHPYLNSNFEALIDRCLIKYFFGQFKMHDLLQKMGQQIVYHESTNEPGRRSRLWCIEDIIHVLNNNTGTEAVEGITLELSLLPMKLSLKGFSKMNKLKMLLCGDSRSDDGFHSMHWYGDFSNFKLSNELRYLQFVGYPLQFLPINFKPRDLVVLEMPYSSIKQLDGLKEFDKLKFVNISFSRNLYEIPDFSGVPNLKELDLQYCTSLSKVHSSLGSLRQLMKLDMEGCECLTNLPNKINLKSLEYLNLAGCTALEKFPDIVGNMTALKCLDLIGVGIQKLPLSIMSFSSLEYLNLCGCLRYRNTFYRGKAYDFNSNLIHGIFIKSVKKKFLRYQRVQTCGFGVLDIESRASSLSCFSPNLFLGFNSLKVLDLSFCNLFDGDMPTNFSCLSSIEFLNLSGNKLTTIPISVYRLSNLMKLHLSFCSNLQTLQKPSPQCFSLLKELNLGYCNLLDGMNLECLGSIYSLEHLNLAGNKFKRVPDLARLPSLLNLYLNDCTQLQALPKLPLSLYWMVLKNCQSLDVSYVESVEGLINDFTFLAIHIDHVGKPYKILKQSSCPRDDGLVFEGNNYEFRNIVGFALASKIPYWFNHRVTSSFGTMGSCFKWLDFEWDACALLILYQVKEPGTAQGEIKKQKLDEHGNSNYKIFEDNNLAPPPFVCHFQDNELGTKASLLICAPEVPSAGRNAFWVYVQKDWFSKHMMGNGLQLLKKGCLDVSIESCNPNVEVECWARGLYKEERWELARVISDISPQALDYETCRILFYEWFIVEGPIKFVESASAAAIL